jgi:hypothetical protein
MTTHRILLSTYEENKATSSTIEPETWLKAAYICLPLRFWHTSGFRIPEWVTPTMEMNLSCGLWVSRDYAYCQRASPEATLTLLTRDDRHAGTILGDETCGVSTRGQHQDRTGILF